MSSTRTEDSVRFLGPLKVVFWPSLKTDRSHQTARVTGKTTGEKEKTLTRIKTTTTTTTILGKSWKPSPFQKNAPPKIFPDVRPKDQLQAFLHHHSIKALLLGERWAGGFFGKKTKSSWWWGLLWGWNSYMYLYLYTNMIYIYTY